MTKKIENIKITPIKGTKNLTITSNFGQRTFYNKITNKKVTGFHNGLDVIGGKIIVAIADGKVIETKHNVKGYTEKQSSGNYVLIEHNNGIKSKYCHMKYNSIKVNVGEQVKVGSELGEMGSTGFATGIHLHLGIKENDTWVNPVDYLLGTKHIDVLVDDNEKKSTSDYFDYIIQKGDTLSGIAKKFGCSVTYLALINNIENINLIYANNIIKIPNGNDENNNKIAKATETEKYVVKKGDTLSSIAKKYNTTWKKIYEKNKKIIGNNPNLIITGQVLEIEV